MGKKIKKIYILKYIGVFIMISSEIKNLEKTSKIKIIEKEKIEIIDEYKMNFIDTGVNPKKAWIPLDYDNCCEIFGDFTEFQTVLYIKILLLIAKNGFLEIYSIPNDEKINLNKKILACDKLVAKKLGISVFKWKKVKENTKFQNLFCTVELKNIDTTQLVWLHPVGNFINNKKYECNTFKPEQVNLKFSDGFCALKEKSTLQCKDIPKYNWFAFPLQYGEKLKTMSIPQSNFYIRVLLEICDKGNFKLEEYDIKTNKINEKLEQENAKLLGIKTNVWRKLKNDPVIKDLFYIQKVQVKGSDVVQTLLYHPSGNLYNNQVYEYKRDILNVKNYAYEYKLNAENPLFVEVEKPTSTPLVDENKELINKEEISVKEQSLKDLQEQQTQNLKEYQQSYKNLTKFKREYEPNHWLKCARVDKTYKLLSAKEFYEKYIDNAEEIDNKCFWEGFLDRLKAKLEKNKEYISDELLLRLACKFDNVSYTKSPRLLNFQLSYEFNENNKKFRPTLESAKRYLELPQEGSEKFAKCLEIFQENNSKPIENDKIKYLQSKVYEITDIANLTQQEQQLVVDNMEIFIKNLIPAYDKNKIDKNVFKAISSYILSLKDADIKDYGRNVIFCQIDIMARVNKFINTKYKDSVLLEYEIRQNREVKKEKEAKKVEEIPKTNLENLPKKVEKDTAQYNFNLERVLLFLEEKLLKRECFNLTKNNSEIDIIKLRHSYKINPLLQKLICLGYTEKDFSKTYEANKMNILNNSNRPIYYLLGIMKNQANGISNSKIKPLFD